MLVDPRTFAVAAAVLLAGTESLRGHRELLNLPVERDHILFQLDIVAGRVAEHEPCLPVVVDDDSRINVPPVRAAERLAEHILVGTFGIVCNRNADGSSAAGLIGSREVEVVFAVALDALRSPRVIRLAP